MCIRDSTGFNSKVLGVFDYIAYMVKNVNVLCTVNYQCGIVLLVVFTYILIVIVRFHFLCCCSALILCLK